MNPVLCLFTDSHEPSGVGEHMLTLADGLRHRYPLVLALPATPAGMLLLRRAADLGLETLPLPTSRDARVDAALRRRLEHGDVGLLHVHAGIGWEGHGGVRAARDAGVAAVMRTEHLPNLLTDREQQAEYQSMAGQIDLTVFVSEAVRASFLSAGLPAGKVRVVHNGIAPRRSRLDRTTTREQLGVPGSATVVLTIGRLTEQKGHADLIEALPAILARRPEAVFLWAGLGPCEQALRERAHALGLGDALRFLGRRDDVPDLLATADLFVLPSRFEGLPLAALEAMAAGLPVVGTRVCGTTEVVQDRVTGRLVPASDAAALAAAILDVLAEPERARRWGAAGRLTVARAFSAERMVRETAALYQALLRRSVAGERTRVTGRPGALLGAARAGS